MSDLGDIGNIIDEKPVVDLNWLDVSEEDYQAQDTLPEDPHESIPELEEQWVRLSDSDFSLASDNKPYMPSVEATERDYTKDIHIAARKLVQAGYSPKQVVQGLLKKYPKQVLASAKTTIKKALDENGLLGHVYVDASLFPSCDKAQVQKNVIASTKDAVYVVAKDKCSGCIHNIGGKCGVFNKEIVMEVEYSQDLLDMYADKLRHEGKRVASSGSYKERLRSAILSSPEAKHTPLDGKPIINTDTGISYKEARKALKEAHVEQIKVEATQTPYHWAGVKDKARERRVRVAHRMMREGHNATFREMVASDPDLAPLRPHVHLLGNLYLHMGVFQNEREASEYLKTASAGVPFVIGTPGGPLDVRVVSGMHEEVAKRCVLNKYGTLDRKEVHVTKVASALVKKTDSDFLAFAQRVYSVPLTQEAKTYEGAYVKPQRMSYEQAYEAFKKASHDREVVDNRHTNQKVMGTALRMLLKSDTVRVATNIKADNDLRCLAPHLYVLGSLYVDTSLFSPEVLKTAYSHRPELKDLPVMDNTNRSEFYTDPSVYGRIADKVANDLVGAIPKERDRVKRTLEQEFSRMSNSEIRKVAQKAFKPVQAARMHTVSAYRGDNSDKFDYEAVEQRVQKIAKAREEALSKVKLTSEGGVTGIDQMLDYDMNPNTSESFGDIDLHEGPQSPLEDVDLGGEFIL